MKVKLVMAIAAMGLFAVSCGGSTENKEEASAKIEETRELGNKLNEIEVEIEALEKAESDIDEAMNELDEI